MPLTRKAPGRKVRCAQGYWAFIPDPLPPALEWSPTLVRALSDADRLIGRLAGEGGRLPNPHVLVRPFVAREAVLSSRIEGTQATLGELLAAEAGAAVERSPADLREVANYVTALEHGIHRLKQLPLSTRLIREIHDKLTRGVRGNTATPGEFRRSQNWIGRPGSTLATASYIPPPPEALGACMGDLEKFLHNQSLPPLAQIALAHYQFEAIHPFLDGNGRVGRLLITLFLVERAILPTPLLYLSAFFEATRQDYYSALRAVSEGAAWEGWLRYVLNGMARQSEDASRRAERINETLAAWRMQVAGSASKVSAVLVERLAANPYVTVKKMSQELGVAFTTAQRAVEKLQKLSIVVQTSEGKRDRVYCATALLKILEEPAQPAPG
jgi:Fic family protein